MAEKYGVSVTPRGFRDGRNWDWVIFVWDLSRFPLLKISFYPFSTLLSFISFHSISSVPVMVRQAWSTSFLAIHRFSIKGGDIASHPSTSPQSGQELIFHWLNYKSESSLFCNGKTTLMGIFSFVSVFSQKNKTYKMCLSERERESVFFCVRVFVCVYLCACVRVRVFFCALVCKNFGPSLTISKPVIRLIRNSGYI